MVSDGYSCLVGDGKAGIGAIGVAVGGGDIGTVGGRVGSTAGVAPRGGLPDSMATRERRRKRQIMCYRKPLKRGFER